MPALPDVPGVCRVDFAQEMDAVTPMLNRWFFKFTGALSTADAATFATLARTEWTTHVIPQQISEVQLRSVTVTDLSSASGAVGIDSTVVTGSSADDRQGADVAFVAQFKIARRYRGGKPKTFIAGIGRNELASMQSWTAGFTTGMASDISQVINGMISGAPAGMGTVSHVSISYFHGFSVVVSPTTGRARNVPLLRATPVVDPVIAVVGDPRVGSQRRRAGTH